MIDGRGLTGDPTTLRGPFAANRASSDCPLTLSAGPLGDPETPAGFVTSVIRSPASVKFTIECLLYYQAPKAELGFIVFIIIVFDFWRQGLPV